MNIEYLANPQLQPRCNHRRIASMFASTSAKTLVSSKRQINPLVWRDFAVYAQESGSSKMAELGTALVRVVRADG